MNHTNLDQCFPLCVAAHGLMIGLFLWVVAALLSVSRTPRVWEEEGDLDYQPRAHIAAGLLPAAGEQRCAVSLCEGVSNW